LKFHKNRVLTKLKKPYFLERGKGCKEEERVTKGYMGYKGLQGVTWVTWVTRGYMGLQGVTRGYKGFVCFMRVLIVLNVLTDRSQQSAIASEPFVDCLE
jgi:hypothetical protein